MKDRRHGLAFQVHSIEGALLEAGSTSNEKGGYDRKSPLEIAAAKDDRKLLDHRACVTSGARDEAAKQKDGKMAKLLDGYANSFCGDSGSVGKERRVGKSIIIHGRSRD